MARARSTACLISSRPISRGRVPRLMPPWLFTPRICEPANADDGVLDRRSRDIFGCFDRLLNRGDRLVEFDDDAFARAARVGDSMPAIAQAERRSPPPPARRSWRCLHQSPSRSFPAGSPFVNEFPDVN